MNLHRLENIVFMGSRYLTIIAVIGSLAGSLLMFVLGLLNVIEAFGYGMTVVTGGLASLSSEEGVANEAGSIINVIESLDRFLIAIVLLYFSYGVYSLFVRPGWPEHTLSLPQWLRIKQIGQLKQVVAEVIIVVLFVLFLRVLLEAFSQGSCAALGWQQLGLFLLMPVSIALLSLSLRMLALHPKPKPVPVEAEAGADPPQPEAR